MEHKKTRKERNSTDLTQKGLSFHIKKFDYFQNLLLELSMLRATSKLTDKGKNKFDY
jgi:hypothetical protein